MRTGEAISDLRGMGGLVVTTREAAMRWRVDQQVAGKRLSRAERDGQVLKLRRGLWSLDPNVKPEVLPPFLTAPYPAYVSFWSALYSHGMIEQIPRMIFVASLDRAQRIETTRGTFQIHHLAPEVFGGFTGGEEAGYLARPEKAIFDAVYVRAAAHGRAYFTELELPPDLDANLLYGWTDRIKGKRLQTLVKKHLDQVLAQAGRQDLVSA
jgi:predicted transcriptional regulator of viral defense system